jgi:mannose-6-phosphate isomerase-like protein (cupin superfamily)
MSMVISEVAPGASIPIHLHRNEDELIFLHTGAGVVTLGDRRVPSSAGAVLYAPKGVWHGIENTGSDVLTWCAIWSPPGFEQYFRETGVPPDFAGVGPTAAQITESARKYGMVFRNPA